MIHIADTKVARRYGDFFIRQIHKLEEVKSCDYHVMVCQVLFMSCLTRLLTGDVSYEN